MSFKHDSNIWWDKNGPYRFLHDINELRFQFIIDRINKHNFQNTSCKKHFNDLSYDPNHELYKDYETDGLKETFQNNQIEILDIGCGGGILSKSLSNYGILVTGIDENKENLSNAIKHASNQGRVEYQHMTLSEYVKVCKKKFDHICAMEVIEHVNDPKQFISDCISLLKPGGFLFISTINRNKKSLFFVKILAEYVLKWVPYDTHEFKKFIKPIELKDLLRGHNFSISDINGISLSIKPTWHQDKKNWFENFFTWKLTDNLDMNYILSAKQNI